MKRFHLLEKIIKENNYKVVVQVGTGKGPTSQHLLKNCSDITLIEIAYYPDRGVDLGSSTIDYNKWWKRIQPYKNRVIVLFGKSEDRVNDVNDRGVDLVFIDADHSYNSCLQDIKIWLPKVRFNGMICGHDYKHPRFPGVQKAVKEVFSDDFEGYSDHDYVWVKTVTD